MELHFYNGMGCAARAKNPGLKAQKVRNMICVVCGRKAKYNEKLNIYYCPEHGLTTWIDESSEKLEITEMRKNAEAVLG